MPVKTRNAWTSQERSFSTQWKKVLMVLILTSPLVTTRTHSGPRLTRGVAEGQNAVARASVADGVKRLKHRLIRASRRILTIESVVEGDRAIKAGGLSRYPPRRVR